MVTAVEIDGAMGEGGGQILRTAMALAIVTGRPVRVHNIRARRSKPGLMPQHLKAVQAAAAISNARLHGAQIASSSLLFEPGTTQPGKYHFDIGTAGATTLVLQTIAVPLSVANASSTVSITGGTHVPWSPSYHYLAWHWGPCLERSGFHIRTTLKRPGFYPKGGGQIAAEIKPLSTPSPVSLLRRGALKQIRGISMVASLDESIAIRQQRQAVKRLAKLGVDINIEVLRLPSYSPGTALILVAEFEQSQCCYGALGARGKPAERVADEAVDALKRFLATEAAVDEHLADQLILPLSVVPGISELHVPQITPHLVTNADIVRHFLPVEIEISGEMRAPGHVKLRGATPVRAF